MPIQEPTKSEDQAEGQEDGDKDEQEFIHEFQELGYSMDENEISTWLNSGSNGPGFQLIADDEICYHVLSEQVPAQEDEPKPEEGESNVCPNGVRITEVHCISSSVQFRPRSAILNSLSHVVTRGL